MRHTVHFALVSILAVAATAGLSSCSTSPEGRRQLIILPDSQMDTMGVQAFTEMKSKTPVDSNATTNAYVKCVANAITDALSEKRAWEVVVFKDEEANAFALPGGKIGVQTGLLKVATNADQLAAVIGHEVGHVLARHGNERASEQLGTQALAGGVGALFGDPNSTKYKVAMGALGVGAQYGVLLPHSRTQESEADTIGLELMAKAGFNPAEAVQLWRNMDRLSAGGAPPEFMSTHPSNERRIADLQAKQGQAVAIFKASGRHPNCRP